MEHADGTDRYDDRRKKESDYHTRIPALVPHFFHLFLPILASPLFFAFSLSSVRHFSFIPSFYFHFPFLPFPFLPPSSPPSFSHFVGLLEGSTDTRTATRSTNLPTHTHTRYGREETGDGKEKDGKKMDVCLSVGNGFAMGIPGSLGLGWLSLGVKWRRWNGECAIGISFFSFWFCCWVLGSFGNVGLGCSRVFMVVCVFFVCFLVVLLLGRGRERGGARKVEQKERWRRGGGEGARSGPLDGQRGRGGRS